MVDSDLAMDLPEGRTSGNPSDQILGSSIDIDSSNSGLSQKASKRESCGWWIKNSEVTKFSAGDCILLMYWLECIVDLWNNSNSSPESG